MEPFVERVPHHVKNKRYSHVLLCGTVSTAEQKNKIPLYIFYYTHSAKYVNTFYSFCTTCRI